MTMTDGHGDRRVHAACDGFEVVRYDRAGKWYVEPRGERKREHVTVAEAAFRALAAEHLGGLIYFHVPGGDRFERHVTANRDLAESTR